MTPRVHDLVRVDPSYVVATHFRDAPEWVAASLSQTPWMVVRRDRPIFGVPVGVRGAHRAQRFAALIDPSDVLERRIPESLCAAAARSSGRLADAARRISAFAGAEGFAWGPTGSFGFELASGRRMTTATSDLDIVARASACARETLLAFERLRAEIAATLDVAVDVELALDIGGVSLREYAAQPATVLAKTSRGVELVPCP